MLMRRKQWLAAGLAFGWMWTACGPAEQPVQSSSAKAPGSSSNQSQTASGPALTPKKVTLDVRSTTEARQLAIDVGVHVPHGWQKGGEGASTASMVAFSPPGDGAGGSSLAVAATCHGPCRASSFIKNIEGAPDIQRALVGQGASIDKRDKIRPGVWGFIATGAAAKPVEAETAKPQPAVRKLVGVTHYQPGWPKPIYCMAVLTGADVRFAHHLYRTCSELKVVVADPALSPTTIAAETRKLGGCPSANKVSYRPQTRVAGEPKDFGAVASGRAVSAGVGRVFVELSSATDSPTDISTLAAGERVLRIELRIDEAEGDVLSGDYAINGDAGSNARVVLHLPGGTSIGNGKATGKVTVHARTHDRICGTLSMTGKRRVEATFSVGLSAGGP